MRTLAIALAGTAWGAVTDTDASGARGVELIKMTFTITGTAFNNLTKRAIVKLPSGINLEPITLDSTNSVTVTGANLDANGMIEVVLIGTDTANQSGYTVMVKTEPLYIPSTILPTNDNKKAQRWYNVPAAAAVAASDTAVHAAMNLLATAQTITTGFTSPAVPRCGRIKGGVAGMSGNVVLNGKNILGEAITETLALNGTTAVEGSKAFASYTSVVLPAETHTSAAQVETATVAGEVTTAGAATVTVTAAGMTGTPKAISVALEVGDVANDIAEKIRTALAADAAVIAMFNVSGATDKVVLTRNTRAANDTTLNIAIADGTSVGVTTAESSANTTAGVAYDTLTIGFNEKLGLPHKLSHNTVQMVFHDNTLESTAATVTVSASAIESNTVDLNTTLNGKALDIYYIA